MRTLQLGSATRDPINPWILVLAGFAAAEFTAWLVCGLPPPHAQGLAALALRSILFVSLTFGAGALATWLPVRFTGRAPRLGLRTVILLAAPGWLLLPALAILFREASLWLLPLTAAAAWMVASGLERLAWFSRDPARPVSQPVPHTPRPFTFASVYGLPGPEFHPAYKFFLAIFAAAAVLLAVCGWFPFASMALAATIFLLVWRWRALTDSRHTWRLRSGAALGRFAASSALLTLLALSLWRAGLIHGPGATVASYTTRSPGDTAGDSTVGEGYHGIILLPPVEKKRPEVSFPVEHSLLSHGVRAHQPLVIPFDGPYWYFKPPNRQPDSTAHIAHGRSTEVNVRSTDVFPLLMQAHQVLSEEIPLKCCSEVVLSIANAEDRPGEIALALVLTDNSTSPEHSVYLGQQILPASQLVHHASLHGPVQESLRFAIPSSARLARFNQIDVIFVPSRARDRTGAKIAVNTFTLIPR